MADRITSVDESEPSRREVLKQAGAVIAAVPLLGLYATGERREELVKLSGPTMGTSWSVRIAEPPPRFDRQRLQVAIERALERVNEQMSTFRSDSEISRFNASRATGWFDVSAETRTVIDEALRIGALSHGAFDVTIAPLVNAWGFGPPESTSGRPDVARIERLLRRVDNAALRTRRTPPAIAKRRPDVAVDLCGIAKGFGLDQVASVCERAGLKRYLIEIGGELRGRGARPGGGDSWLVGIERPVVGATAVHQVVRLDDRALATSGNYRAFFERDGVRFCHVIDPRTGRPVSHTLASVSVLAATAIEADATSTALLVLGAKAGWRLARQQRIAAMFITRRDEDFVERRTPEFDRFVVSET